jgi:hypothetical protein
MAFFRNTAVNLLNLHYGIFAIVTTGGGAFICVYLLKAGVSAPGVLAAMAVILLARFLIRPMVVPLAVRFGLKRLVILGTVLMATQFPVLAEVHGANLALYGYILAGAIADTVYWSSYHAFFAVLGDAEHRGHQLGMREAISAVVGIVSPIAMGWVLVAFGPRTAFGASAAAAVLAALPLLWTPKIEVAREAPGAFRAAWPGVKIFLTDGWMGSGLVFVWQLALFVSLGENYLHFGGALALAALVGAIAGLFLGRYIDSGGGIRALLVATGGLAAVILLRAASSGHPVLAVAANALANVGNCLYIPVEMTAVYNLAKRSPCTLRFHVATEGAWDVGGGSASLIAAGMLWAGLPISAALLLPLVGLVTGFVLLRRYYTEHGEIRQLEPVAVTGATPTTEI